MGFSGSQWKLGGKRRTQQTYRQRPGRSSVRSKTSYAIIISPKQTRGNGQMRPGHFLNHLLITPTVLQQTFWSPPRDQVQLGLCGGGFSLPGQPVGCNSSEGGRMVRRVQARSRPDQGILDRTKIHRPSGGLAVTAQRRLNTQPSRQHELTARNRTHLTKRESGAEAAARKGEGRRRGTRDEGRTSGSQKTSPDQSKRQGADLPRVVPLALSSCSLSDQWSHSIMLLCCKYVFLPHGWATSCDEKTTYDRVE